MVAQSKLPPQNYVRLNKRAVTEPPASISEHRKSTKNEKQKSRNRRPELRGLLTTLSNHAANDFAAGQQVTPLLKKFETK